MDRFADSGELDVEGRSLSGCGADIDFSSMLFDYTVADGQAQARTAAIGLGGENGSKMRWICSRGMPAPVSAISTSTLPLCAAVRTSNMPPLGMASRAFRKRFRKTCCSLLAEPRTAGSGSPNCLTI